MPRDVFHGVKNYFRISCRGRNYFSALKFVENSVVFQIFCAASHKFFGISFKRDRKVAFFSSQTWSLKKTPISSHSWNFLLPTHFYFKVFIFQVHHVYEFYVFAIDFIYACVFWALVYHVHCICFLKIFAWSTWVLICFENIGLGYIFHFPCVFGNISHNLHHFASFTLHNAHHLFDKTLQWKVSCFSCITLHQLHSLICIVSYIWSRLGSSHSWFASFFT